MHAIAFPLIPNLGVCGVGSGGNNAVACLRLREIIAGRPPRAAAPAEDEDRPTASTSSRSAVAHNPIELAFAATWPCEGDVVPALDVDLLAS